jgi:hypothetical protein
LADEEIATPTEFPPYDDTGGAAPLIYFDIVGAYGIMHGAIELELATRILVRWQDLPIAIRHDTMENADVGYEHPHASRQAG